MTDEVVQQLSNSRKRKSLGETSKQEQAHKKQARLRTTVLNPREIQWPEISVSEEGKAQVLLNIKSLGEALNIPCRKVPLNEIRKVPKPERHEFRKQWIMNEALRLNLNFHWQASILLRSTVAMGVNCVSKALELDMLSAVIIEQDVNPPIITKVLLPLANSKGIPIISLDGLNSTFQKASGIRCIALGLKKSCELISHKCFPLLQLVKKLASGEDEVDEDEESPEPSSQSCSEDMV